MKVKLCDLAQARSGDKGNSVDISLFAKNEELYELFKKEITAAKVKVHFASLCKGKVERFEVANVRALKFVLHEALGGGAPMSLRIDNLGKSLSAALFRMEVEVPDDIIRKIDVKSPPKQFEMSN